MPRVRVIDQALLTENRLDDEAHTAVGAVYDASGSVVPESVRDVDRTDRHHPADPPTIERPHVVIGRYNRPTGIDSYLKEAIYGGHIMAGWGHNITETISTAWAAPSLPDVPLVLAPWGRVWASALPRVQEILAAAGWGERPVLVTSATIAFSQLHIPERLIRLEELMHEQSPIDRTMNVVYDRIVSHFAPTITNHGAPVFLARPGGHRREHPAERSLERMLRAHGIRIVHGWQLSAKDQISIAADASALIGFSGSNLHNSVFARPGIPVIELQDYRAIQDKKSGKTSLQHPLCQLRKQDYLEIPCFTQSEPIAAEHIIQNVLRLLS